MYLGPVTPTTSDRDENPTPPEPTSKSLWRAVNRLGGGSAGGADCAAAGPVNADDTSGATDATSAVTTTPTTRRHAMTATPTLPPPAR